MAITSRTLRERGPRQARQLGIDAERVPPGQYLTEGFRKLEIMSADRMGFWELNGYHNEANPWREQRHWF